MCGIVGIVHADGSPPAQERLDAALELLATRGPDAAGRWLGPGIGLGHRRLAVIDPLSRADQPMVSTDRRFVIVFNGEIYNYRSLRKDPDLAHVQWRTESDTEVVLAGFAAWGRDCVLKFEGMFSFAIWDCELQELFCARDRLGVKPFYYRSTPRTIAFGSRPRAVRVADGAPSLSIDRDAICAYLDLGFFPAPLTALEDMRKLPPGCRLTWKAGRIDVDRYWSPTALETHRIVRAGDRRLDLDTLEALVLDAVQSRLVSDVPVGAFLSGGIDSSVVVAAMAKLRGNDVETFTIGFSESGSDESARARAVANRLGVKNTCEVFSADDLLALFPVFLKAFDEPFFDSSAFPVMAVSRLARTRVTVALSGDGGDELFGGYTYYQWMRWFSAVDRLGPIPRGLLASALRLSHHPRAMMTGAAMTQPDAAARYAFLRGLRKDLPDVVSREVRDNSGGGLVWYRSAAAEVHRAAVDPAVWSEVDKLLILPEGYLQKVDVASMAYSLEVREPLLATALVEWAAGLPGSQKVGWFHGKRYLRELAAKWVGRDLQENRKRGFSAPIGSWLRGPLKAWSEELCNDRSVLRELGLEHGRVVDLWTTQQSGRRSVHAYLWAVLMLVAWYREESSVVAGTP